MKRWLAAQPEATNTRIDAEVDPLIGEIASLVQLL
jgi:hypothetical protein